MPLSQPGRKNGTYTENSPNNYLPGTVFLFAVNYPNIIFSVLYFTAITPQIRAAAHRVSNTAIRKFIIIRFLPYIYDPL